MVRVKTPKSVRLNDFIHKAAWEIYGQPLPESCEWEEYCEATNYMIEGDNVLTLISEEDNVILSFNKDQWLEVQIG